MSTLDPNEFDVAYGRHSNIPDCCIKFFIGEWQNIWPDRWNSRKYFKGYPHVGYVPCRKCQRTKNYVRVHKCTAVCDEFRSTLGLETRGPWRITVGKEMFI